MYDPSIVDDLAGLGPNELLERLSVPSRLGVSPGLERMRRLLDALGNPQIGLPVLHVGGTSGKGSTSTIAARILREAGYRVGLHVKPHLESVEERFVVDGAPIASTALARLLREAAPAARAVAPSWYELTVAVALQHFRAERVDLAVVEVGLGGTYDGTNVVEPLVAVLTNVGLDHTEVLGDTIEKIVADKSGILKPGGLAVSGVVQPSAAAIVAERCQINQVPLWRLGEEVRFRVTRVDERGSTFDLELPDRSLSDLDLGLLGVHQVANAAVAVAAVVRLGERGFVVPDDAIRVGLRAAQVPGRLEVIRRAPRLVLDGAHNPDKMSALACALRTLYPGRRTIGVVAFKRGHDVPGTVARLAPVLDEAIATTFEATTDFGPGQALLPAKVGEILDEAKIGRVSVEDDPIRAVERALGSAGPDDVVVVTGSLYLVGVIRRWARE